MAEVPYINPSRPIWPARPNEIPVKRRHSTEDERNEKKHHKEDKENDKDSGKGHLDEYV